MMYIMKVYNKYLNVGYIKMKRLRIIIDQVGFYHFWT